MNIRLILIATLALLGGALAALIATRPSATPPIQSAGAALVGGPFRLVDQTGAEKTDESFRGRHMLVVFGYTYCPDICPAELQVMTAALETLGPEGEQVAPVFITVDPQRDTPEHLREYMKSFHPRFTALTGSPEATAAAAKAYRVYAAKAPDSGSAADYLIDHSAFIYLMGPDGRYLTHFAYGVTPEALARGVRKHLNSGA
ncbi:MAG: SCO family protein [Hyphomicrobiales bacterium]|nr:SCO family protein [Hyphomicrobiales bacterium]